MSSVANYRPNMSISPGPMIVIKPLSLNPSIKYNKNMFHFYWQKSPKNLHIKSKIMTIRRVLLNPYLSPKWPQNGPPTMEDKVRATAQRAR